MLPDSEDIPTSLQQLGRDLPIPASVPIQLIAPILLVRFRRAIASGAAVPLAAIDEHGEPNRLEGKIRCPRQSPNTNAPASKPGLINLARNAHSVDRFPRERTAAIISDRVLALDPSIGSKHNPIGG